MINVDIDLNKTEGKSDNSNGYGLSNEQIEKIIKRVMSEPTFRRGKVETSIYVFSKEGNDDEIIVELGLFDFWDEEGEDDIWGDSPTMTYQLSDFIE